MTPIDLDGFVLTRGSHRNWAAGSCLLEAVSYMAGEPWSDYPECASPVLAAYGRSLNDMLPDDLRQRLKPFIPGLIGTAGDGQDEARGLVAANWLIRVYTPAWLELAPELREDATRLAALPPLMCLKDAAAITELVQEIDSRAAAARGSALRATAVTPYQYVVITDTVQSAINVTAGAEAKTVVEATSFWGISLRDVPLNFPWDEALGAARDAAAVVTITAAKGDPWERLAPTVTTLQTSAVDLLGRMINPSEVAV